MITFPLYSKYKVNHIFINPEAYLGFRSYKNNTPIRLLVLSPDLTIPPVIYTENVHVILNKVIPKAPLEKIILDQHFHIYLNKLAEECAFPINIVATKLYRLYCSTFYGYNTSDSIFGPAVICGSFNPTSGINNGLDYSTPYEVVEQCLRLYENTI